MNILAGMGHKHCKIQKEKKTSNTVCIKQKGTIFTEEYKGVMSQCLKPF